MDRAFALGVIGVGNMGGALVRGIVRAGLLGPGEIVVSDAQAAQVAAVAQEAGVEQAADNREVATRSRYIVLAVKPGIVPSILEEIADALGPDQTVVSVAAGVPLSVLRTSLGRAGAALIRVMPNTPALVGAGVFAVAAPGVPAERTAELTRMLDALGEVVEVEEAMMDAITGLSGSGPAFVFAMIQALADGGTAAGLAGDMALRLAAQTVAGAGKMVVETGQSPEALKDAVASPGGTTVAGLAELDRLGFRDAVVSAVCAAAARARELSESR
jgi:pyrroline-5-carboxylate reductase